VLDEAAGELPVRRIGWRGPSRPARRRALPHPSLGGAVTAVAALVAVGVVVVALGVLRHSPAASPAGAASSGRHLPGLLAHLSPGQRREVARLDQVVISWEARAGCQPRPPALRQGAPSHELLSLIGVLRRAQQPSDVLPKQVLTPLGLGTYIDYVRLARRVGATRYYIVPARGLATPMLSRRCHTAVRATMLRADATLPKRLRVPVAVLLPVQQKVPTERPAAQLCLISVHRNASFTGDCEVTSAIESGQLIEQTATVFAGIVPDGVASVLLRYPRRTVTERVVDNVFVAHVAHGEDAVPPRIVWRGASGRVIRQAPRTATSGMGFAMASVQARSAPGR